MLDLAISFFSYGFPSALVRLSAIGGAAKENGSEMGDTKEEPAPRWLDFQITQRIIYLCKLTN
jgi:hypothetical protein